MPGELSHGANSGLPLCAKRRSGDAHGKGSFVRVCCVACWRHIAFAINGRTVNGEKVNMFDNIAVNEKSGVTPTR